MSWWLIFLGTSGALYAVVTHWPLYQAITVPHLWPDQYVPLVPWTVVLYLSYFLVFPTLILTASRKPWLFEVFFAGVLASALCLVSHLALPTQLIRPSPTDSVLLSWLYAVDAPLAAFPSGHVALPIALCLTLYRHCARRGFLFLIWSLVIGVSALTTGQHVAADLAGGLLYGTLSWVLVSLGRRFGLDARSACALVIEWLVIATAVVTALTLNHLLVYGVAVVIIATRQHALLMLFHDAVHGHLARDLRVNDALINATVGIWHGLPVEVYRHLHLAHHQTLGTSADPERNFLYAKQPWRYRALPRGPLLRQLAGDLLLVNAWKTFSMWRQSGGVVNVTRATIWMAILAASLAIGSAIVEPVLVLKLMLLWVIPLITLTNLLQKIRSFAEHSDGIHPQLRWHGLSYSWAVGWLGRLTLWPYHINLHREHHRSPQTPWHQLPYLVSTDERQLRGAELPALLLTADS